ncbi:MAG: coenzyme F420-0:L-glutamate ligase [Nitrososphaerales archaeon]|nr:coenzyme F420-0:L-glutamate ligase [Nitrososphaerales archaeon]
MNRLLVIPLAGIPQVEPGANLVALILAGLKKTGVKLADNDVVVVKQKVVSKAEGRLVNLDYVKPGEVAFRIAREQGKDPRLVEVVLGEAVRIVRVGNGVIITETRHGFVCANSGVDKSNVRDGYVTLLPLDPDASARSIRRGLEKRTGKRLAVLITDTFGRPWRRGQTDVAIGCSGIGPLTSYRGKADRHGYMLKVTEPAVVDEIAGAAELVTGKLSDTPVALVRGVKYARSEKGVKTLILEKEKDLFR